MTTHEQVISLYEAVADITGEMLVAARAGDWSRVASLETGYASRVRSFERLVPEGPLTDALRERKIELIGRILDDDRAIRELAEPCLARLSAMLHGTSNRRRLEEAYGATPGD